MHSPPIYASLLLLFWFGLVFLGLVLLFFSFPFFFFGGGGNGWQGLNPRCVCVMLLTAPAATCSMWPTAPPQPPTPPHILLLHISGHPPSSAGSPHSICASCLPQTVWRSWKGLMNPNMSRSPNQHTVLAATTKKSQLVVLQYLHVDFYDRGPLTSFILT